MVRVSLSGWLTALGLVIIVALPTATASGAVGDPEVQNASVLAAPARIPHGTANVELRFVQEDGPASGHVRVVLTPETPLSIFEARSAAQQAFLAALNEPGLGDNLRRTTVVVRLMPESDPAISEQVIRFVHKGGSDWTILPGE